MTSRAKLYALILSFIVLSVLAFSLPQSIVNVEVFLDGSAHVVYTFPTNGSATIDVRLVGQPDTSMVVLVQNEKGEPLPYSINDTSNIMSIITLDSTQVTIDYYTSTITSKVSGRWIVNFSSPLPIILRLPPNATLSTIYVVPESVTTQGSSLVLAFKPGPVVVGYVLPSAAQTRPASQKPPVSGGQSGGSTPLPSQSTPTASPPVQQPINPLYLAIAAGAVIVVLVLFIILRRREGGEGLSEVDAQIVEILKSAGGGLFQSELTGKLGLPTTTVWRHIRKLESLGIVVVEKKFGRNFVRLARKA